MDELCKHPDGCPERAKVKGWCYRHYNRVLRDGEPGPVGLKRRPNNQICQHLDGCPQKAEFNGWCGMHWQRIQTHGEPGIAGRLQRLPRTPAPPCKHSDGCERPASSQGWCLMHYLRVRRDGEPGPVGTLEFVDPAPEGFRTCRRCKTVQSLDQFYRSQRKGEQGGWCKHCFREHNQLKKYGIAVTPTDVCAICKGGDDLVIDHCHNTEAVRGILCTPCNKGLGFFADDPKRLRAALRYLNRCRVPQWWSQAFTATVTGTGS